MAAAVIELLYGDTILGSALWRWTISNDSFIRHTYAIYAYCPFSMLFCEGISFLSFRKSTQYGPNNDDDDSYNGNT